MKESYWNKAIKKERDLDIFARKHNEEFRDTSKRTKHYIEIGDLYLNAAERNLKLRGYEKALQYYKKAKEISPESLKNEISEKIKELDDLRPKQIFSFAILSIASLVFAFVFTSVSLTGYSVFELTQNNSRFVGTIFFILGLVFAFVYFKKRRDNGKK